MSNSKDELVVGLGIVDLAVPEDTLLSSFVESKPNTDYDIKPSSKFYVVAGQYKAGTIIDFETVSKTAAVCEATKGDKSF